MTAQHEVLNSILDEREQQAAGQPAEEQQGGEDAQQKLYGKHLCNSGARETLLPASPPAL